MDKRNQLKPKKAKERNAPHIERQRMAQMQPSSPAAPVQAPQGHSDFQGKPPQR